MDSESFDYDCDYTVAPADSACVRARETNYSDTFTFDLEAAYSFDAGTTFVLGVQNFTDQFPDRSPTGGNNGQLYHENAPFGPNGGFWYARLPLRLLARARR